jgi:ATP phosphoribosyltransferase regulatory subunit
LSEQANLNQQQEAELFDVLQRKARAELEELVNSFAIEPAFKKLFITLPKLNGDRDVLNQATNLMLEECKSVLLNKTDKCKIQKALADLQSLADKLQRDFPSLTVSFDLAELRGYHYHTGIVFAAFTPSIGREIARGGRYDNIGQIFGRARAATGFSADLKVLVNLFKASISAEANTIVFAPYGEDQDLLHAIRDLRAQGTTVIQNLPNQLGTPHDLGCTSILEKQDQRWVVKPLA